MAQDYKPPLMRLGVGIGFEQMNLKTNAIIRNFAYPTNTLTTNGLRGGAFFTELKLQETQILCF
jgi:hypothetical protein